jgi:hypothetical protein
MLFFLFRLFADKGKDIDGDSFFVVSGRVWDDGHIVVLGYPRVGHAEL